MRNKFDKWLSHELTLFGIGCHHVNEAVYGKRGTQLGHCQQPADGIKPPEAWQTVVPHSCQQLLYVWMSHKLEK